MESYSSNSLQNALENQVRRLEKKITNLGQRSRRISTIRLLYFFGGLFLIYLSAGSDNSWIFGIVTATVIASFIALISWHRTIDRAVSRLSAFAKIRRQHLARMSLDWEQIPDSATQENYHSHPFARDFNVVGDHSLLQLMDTASYPGSKKLLEGWLTETTPDLTEIKTRQQLAKELKPMAYFRDRLHLYAELAKKKQTESDWSMGDLLAWLRSSQKKGFNTPLVILGSLALINIVLLLLFLAGIINPYFIISFIIYLLIYNFYSSKIEGVFDDAYQINELLSQFREILSFLESFPYQSGSVLGEFCSVFHHKSERPSHFLKKILRITSATALQNNDIIRFVINSIGPWDLYFARKLNTYKKDLEPKLSKWLQVFYKLEAINSIANFSWLNPEYFFALPQKNDALGPAFEAENLGHPLIPKNKKVTNDVTINHTGDIMLITGSNMAGKSTFLRTVGINLALCFAGAPVNAHSFRTALFRLFSSINVTDSLDEGLSHFYAEVKRLRALLDQLNQPNELPLFFMVDEIYRGTNNRERLTGSAAFLKKVAGKKGVGLVSTHDLELAQLEEKIPSLNNWHFAETIEDGKMHFEYKLKAGPCPSTNALKIMEMEGLPV